MTILVDTNVVIALLDDTNSFHIWASGQVVSLKASSAPLIVPDIVYCEVSVAMQRQEQVDQAIEQLGLERLPPTDATLFRAGKAFKQYRDVNKGTKLGVLPDFLIGAMADTLNVPLLTANPKDFVGYFPNLVLIVPPAVTANAQAGPQAAAAALA